MIQFTAFLILMEKVTRIEKVIDRDSMMKAIDIVKDGIHIGDIGSTIQTHVEAEGFSVVQDFCGHGIGNEFHEEPQIVHYKNNDRRVLKEGMCFTIEPMINLGKFETKTLKHFLVYKIFFAKLYF